RDHAGFERMLYVIRKLFEKAVAALDIPENKFAYIPSLSSNTLIYKGMLSADQIVTMYPDLADPDVESALALVHQRFSTNTFPSWPLAHPYRYIAHNGEINTLRGNINWMRAREALCRSDLFGDDLRKVLPVTREGLSDSATFDNVLEFLVMNGRSLPHAILMMIPEPWQHHESMSPERRAFYDYHSSLMEPWDGPASIAFTDGTVIGAVLDRNGLRPSRYYVTRDDLVVMASEVGVLDIPPEKVLVKERLHPGKIFLVDTAQGRIIDDDEIKAQLAAEHPYGDWLRQNQVRLEDVAAAPVTESDHATVLTRQMAFGYTHEDLRLLLAPMAKNGEEPIGSMGTDTALAVLSDRGVTRELAPIPSLLATAAVHHHLVRHGERTRCGLVVETGDAREVHHMCLLIGYGAGAVNPWVAFETLDDLIQEGVLAGLDRAKAVKNYIKALNKGILKVMAKMGISTLQSYCGAQIFEAIGLNRAVVDRYFTGTASRVGGIGIDVIAEEVRQRHAAAYPERPVEKPELDWGGEYQWRRDGEHHQVNPDMIAKLQASTRAGSYAAFKEYSKIVDDQSRHRATLRGLFTLKPAGPSVPLDEVES